MKSSYKLLGVLWLVGLACSRALAAPQRAPASVSPFYTAMVNLTSVPPYRAPLKPAAAGAPLRRAAGYPVSINDSRPAMQRHFQAASLSGDGALQGPAVLPQLPELGLGRKLRQVADAASVTLADVTAAAAAEDAAAGDALAAAAVAAPPPACAAGPACLTPRGGFSGLDAPPAGALSLAVGPRHAVQTAGGAMMVSNLGPDGSKTSTLRTVALRSFFAGVAPSCTGVDDASAVYDKHAGRFVIAASCGGFGRLLIAVSSTSSAAGTWFLFGLIADAVDTKLECTSPREQALADYPQVGYNKDGLFVTYYSYCPSDPSTSGAMLVALPKFKAYQGAPNMYAAVYSAAEVAAAGGVPGGAGAVRQLQPVVPQAAEDVAEGVAYFVADHRPRSGPKRSSFTLVSLVNTGALWAWADGLNGVPSPTLLAAVVPWGQPAPIYADAMLKQPGGGANLAPGGANPVGFWSGGAALSRGKLLLTTRADITDDGGLYTPRPGVIWAEIAPQITYADATGDAGGAPFTVAAAECPAAVANGMAATFDWSKDYSLTWGSEFASNWSSTLGFLTAAAAAKPRARRPLRSSAGTSAAGVVLDRQARLQQAAPTSRAANFLAMGFGPQAAGIGSMIGGAIGSLIRGGGASGAGGPSGGAGYRGRSGGCSCQSSCGWGDLQSYNYVYNFDDYCDAGYNQWGPESGNDMFGSNYNGAYCTGNAAFGLVGNNQYDQCGGWCAIRCPGGQYGGVASYTAPRYNFYGATNYYPSLTYASLPSSSSTSDAATAPASLDAAAAAPVAPTTPTKPMRAAACAAAASLAFSASRVGSVDAGGAIGLAYPVVAVAPNGAAVIAFVYSGPGKTPDDQDMAYPGVGAAFLDASASGALPMATLSRSAAVLEPSAAGGVVTWGELSAAGTHPVTGSVYIAARRGGLTRTLRGTVGTWVGIVDQALGR